MCRAQDRASHYDTEIKPGSRTSRALGEPAVRQTREQRIMSEGEVRYSRKGEIATVLFDRPAARNAMTWRMYDQLTDICGHLRMERDVRVVVFRGVGGKAFIAGTDIAQFRSFTSGEDGIDYEKRMEGYVSGVETLPMPTLAVVEGFAIGGGLAIALACDLRIAAPESRFGVPVARTLGNCLSMTNYA